MKTESILICQAMLAASKREEAQEQTRRLKERLEGMVRMISETKPAKYTGWFVMLKKNEHAESGFAFAGIFNPDVMDGEAEPEWDMCIPIMEPDESHEFGGW